MSGNIYISIPNILTYVTIKIYVLLFLLLVLWLITLAPAV